MDFTLRFKLSTMMFLQYAAWGVWLPILPAYLGSYLGFTPLQVGQIVGSAAAVGAITGPFISGWLADRYFSTEKFLAFSMLLGGVLMFIMASTTTFVPFLVLSIIYSIIYFPTISLTNSLSFHHLPDPDSQFGKIRVFGTIGWIAIGWAYSLLWLQPAEAVSEAAKSSAMADCLRWSGVISLVYGVFCFFLPHTPPAKDAKQPAPLKALALLKNPAFLILFLVSFPISVIHTWYFIYTSPFLIANGIAASKTIMYMTIGQVSELIILGIVVGILTPKLGLKKMMLIGIVAYVARFLIFSMVTMPTAPVLSAISIAFHGFCFGCFYVSAFIFVDKVCATDIRASAQNLFGIFIIGVGPLVAGNLSGPIETYFTSAEGVVNYGGLWQVPTLVAAIALIFFALFFKFNDAEHVKPAS